MLRSAGGAKPKHRGGTLRCHNNNSRHYSEAKYHLARAARLLDGGLAQLGVAKMKKFVRQKPTDTAAIATNIDFGAASAQIARVLDPEVYALRIESARIVLSNNNTLVVLDIIEIDSGARVALQPLWVDGPNASVGRLAAENQHLVAQLLTLAGLPTAGNVGSLIPQLMGLEFDARLAFAIDNRSGRTYNALAVIYVDDAP
jgi:hypothetical protein